MAKKKNDGVSDLTEKLGTLQIDNDAKFMGLQGLDPNSILYRVCRPDEDLDGDILSKARDEKSEEIQTVNKHINCGSRKASRYISTTTSPQVAREWACYAKEDAGKGKKPTERESPHRIIKISLSQIQNEEKNKLINLNNEEVRNHFVSGATQINRVKSSQEVIFQWKIPKAMFSEWENPGKLPYPK